MKLRAQSLILILATMLLGGCLESWRRPQKAPGSALWLKEGAEPLTSSSLARLREAGVAELFVEVARLDPEAPGFLRRLDLPKLPPSTSATLAISGDWSSSAGAPEEVAAELIEALRQLRFDAENRGLIPAGFHFDLTSVDTFEAYGKFLAELRGELDRTLFLSASVQRDWIEGPALGELDAGVDFVVAFLYGQRVFEPEDASAWDFVSLQRSLEKLDETGIPHLLGVIGLGTATHLSPHETVKARTTLLSLQEIVWDRRLKLQPGFSLAGVNRRVYEVKADRATEIGKWEVQPGDKIRVVRAATTDLEELLRLLGAWDLSHHLGELYYRLPSEEERLSLALENLLNALDPEPASPDLELGASVQRRSGRGWILRFSITNRNREITELSLLDNNYLQVTTHQGWFSERARVGDFYRYDLGVVTEDGGWDRQIHQASSIRLHVPILEGQQQVTSGDVELYAGGDPELDIAASFLLPDGRTLEVGPYVFRDGRVEDGREEMVETESE